MMTELLYCALAASVVMVLLWLLQLRTRNAGIVDVGWAGILGSLAVAAAFLGDGWLPRRILVALMGGIWGYRLAWHLLRDRIIGKPEEGRYVRLRELWGNYLQRAFFLFFQGQALLTIVLAIPFFLSAGIRSEGWTMLDFAAATLWFVGIAGESIADHQLSRFKADPSSAGRTCRVGLWKYSRHPNYFFEWVLWCGNGCLALAAANGWLGLLSPALILFFILRVTGIPPTEAHALRSRGDEYREYQRTTSAFFPWFPKET